MNEVISSLSDGFASLSQEMRLIASDPIYLWDLIGTFVFGISGVLLGLERRMDIFGMFILAFVTGVGGGTLRDIMIGSLLDEESHVYLYDWCECRLYLVF